MKKAKRAIGQLMIMALAMLASAPLWALGGGPDGSEWSGQEAGENMTDLGTLQEFLHWLIADSGGNIIVLLGVIVAMVMMVASASMRPVMFVLGLAVLVGWGPGVFLWIASAGAEADLVTAWVVSR